MFAAPDAQWPQAMLEIAWAHHFARFWRFDQTGRRDREIEFRLLPDRRLSCLRSTAWHYADPDQAEFDERHVHHSASAFRPDGTVRTTTRIPGGSTSETIERKPADGLHMPAPPFGEWADFLGRPGHASTTARTNRPTRHGVPRSRSGRATRTCSSGQDAGRCRTGRSRPKYAAPAPSG
ncbi:hypothetical protein [Amycolatopsis sp. 3B14]|uniref:hypothetical protein n=1 Tax=Amycolatopsis sp. 3B14 TaxID=3243600 RepID=UPI003D9831FC